MAAKDGLIQQKEKLYVELKSILARQPGPEVAEQLQIYQDNLGEKQKQLKAMTAELNMHRGQVSDLKLDQEHLVSQLAQLKKRYFSRKQQERRQRAMYGGMDLGMDLDVDLDRPSQQETAEHRYDDFGGEGGEPPDATGGGFGGAAALGGALG